MSRLVLRSSIVSGGGGAGLYTPRDPTGSDKFVNFSAGSDGTGTEASPWNVLSTARLQSVAASQQLVVSGNGAFHDTTSQVTVATSSTRIVVRSHPSAPGSGFTFSGLGSRIGGATYWDFYRLALACSNGYGMCSGQRDDFNGGPLGNFNRWIECIGTKSLDPPTGVNAGTGIIYCAGTSGNRTRGHEVILGSYTGTGSGNGNCANLFFDYPQDILLLAVLCQLCPTPLYWKHTDVDSAATPGGTVRNCIFLDGANRGSLNHVVYENNAFGDSGLGLDEQGGGLENSKHCTFLHNTFFNSDWLASQENGGADTSDNTALNNAMLGTSRFYNAGFSPTDANNSIDYSACEGTGTNHYYRNSTQRTLAGYKSTYPTQEVNGLAGTMALVGGSSPGDTPSNWALAPGSVGIGNASDGGDRGVDASKLLTIN